LNGLKQLRKKVKSKMSSGSLNRNSNKNLVKITRIILLIGIILTSGFIIYEIIKIEPSYYTFGLLNSDGNAGDYPTQAKKNENITLYVTVGNFLDTNFSFSIHLLKGNQSTRINGETESNGTLVKKLPKNTIEHGDEWTSEAQNISFSKTGLNHTIIFELWKIETTSEFFYDILVIRLNVTES